MSRPVVLVIEDNPDNLMLVGALLEDDYEVESRLDGASGLAAFRNRVPSVVLLDISLPHMSGEDVLRELRKLPGGNEVKVIALTAHAMAGDRERFLEQGFDGYVAKPIVDPMVLLDALATHVAARGGR